MPPIALPFYDDFETGAPYWIMEDSWGLQEGIYHSSTNSLTESPDGEYEANLDISTTLRALDFTEASSAQISFWTRYNIEGGYDYMYLEVSTNGTDWDQIDSYTDNQNTWVQKTYSLDNYLDETNVIIRFRFSSDVYVEEEGMFIDDLEVMINFVGLDEEMFASNKTNLVFHPNPVKNITTIDILIENAGVAKLQLFDSKGQLVKTISEKWMDAGLHQEAFDVSDLKSGIYYGTLECSGRKISRKLVISR